MSRHCDNCGKPTVFGSTYCSPCERVFGEGVETPILTAAQAYGRPAPKPDDFDRDPMRAAARPGEVALIEEGGEKILAVFTGDLEIEAMRNASRLLEDLVDMHEHGTEAAARVADWLAAKYGSRRQHESNS